MRAGHGHIDGRRLGGFYVLIGVVLIVFVARLIQLQVIDSDELAAVAIENREAEVNLPAPRGVIFDRNGVILARNIPSFNVSITPSQLPDDDVRLQEIYRRISELTNVPINTPPLDAGNATGNRLGDDSPLPGIENVVDLQESLAPHQSVIVAPDIEKEVAFILSEELRDLPGVSIDVRPLRDYPTRAVTAHLIGYMGPITVEVEDFYNELGFDASRDKIGYAGIEVAMQDILAGRNGLKRIEEDVAGLELRTVGDVRQPEPGNDVVLTIDVRLQAAAEAAVRRRLEIENQFRGAGTVNNGVAIAMNPKTGEILAMVSYPTYDNQFFAQFIPVSYYTEMLEHPYRPLFNQAISGEHPPGSVFKIVIAAGALEEGVVTPEQEIFDPGRITITNRYFPNDPGKSREVVCWKRDGHGNMNFINGFAHSCDVYFYSLGGGYEKGGVPGTGLGIDRIYKYANMLGFNEPTGIEMLGERGGLVPNRDWKRLNLGENWATGDTYIASIGQGFILATPLQVLNSFTPFINRDGVLIQPTVIREVRDGEGNIVQPFEPRIIHKTPLSQFTIDLISQGMREAMTIGTGKDLSIFNFNLGGKSGTAEYCDNIAQAADRCQFGAWPAHAWFVGYAPYEDPEIAVVAFIYNGEEGSKVAGPVVTEIIQAYFDLKSIDETGSVPERPDETEIIPEEDIEAPSEEETNAGN